MIVDPTTQMPAPATPTGAKSATTPAATGTNALGKDAFLNLLVTQLKNQDPTAPQDDTQFVAQLATFSSLEKLSTMDASLTSILQLLQDSAKSATGTTDGGATTATGTPNNT